MSWRVVAKTLMTTPQQQPAASTISSCRMKNIHLYNLLGHSFCALHALSHAFTQIQKWKLFNQQLAKVVHADHQFQHYLRLYPENR